MKVKLCDFFVCQKCQATCGEAAGCISDHYPRKQELKCLGEYCEEPCEFQTESDLTVDHLVPLVKFLGDELNKLMIKE